MINIIGSQPQVARRCLSWLVIRNGLLLAVLLAIGGQVGASPYSLFLRLDSASIAEGGADVPGQITGRPQVRRPASLRQADQPLLKLDYTSQTPVIMERDDTRVGQWDTEILKGQYIFPIGESAKQRRCTLGLEMDWSDNDIAYQAPDADYRLSASSDSQMLSLAYEMAPEWTVGAGCRRTDTDSLVQAPALAQYLGLPADTTDWPGLSSRSTTYTLGLSHRQPQEQWGLQYNWSSPGQRLHTAIGSDHYAAALSGDTHRLEAYTARQKGDELYFLSGWDWASRSRGNFLVGLAGIVQVDLSMKDRSLILGWRKGDRFGGQQVTVDWRKTSFWTDNHGYAGIIPGMSEEVAALGADGALSTYSVRYGRQTPLGDRFTLLSGLSAHRGVTDADLLAQVAPEVGEDLETVVQSQVRGGRLYLYVLSVGLSYEDDNYRAALTYGSGYANANSAFKEAVHDGDAEPDDEHHNHLKARDFMTFSFQTVF